MDFNSLENSIKSDKVLPVYVIYGDEYFLIRQALFLIKDKVLDKELIDLLLVEYNGDDVSFGRVFDDLWTVPLLGVENKRLILVENAGELLKNFEAKIKEYVSAPSPYSFLVFVCDSVSAWVKKAEGDKLITVECKKLKEYQLESWITKRAKFYGKKISPGALKILVDETGSDLSVLENHLTKLSTYSGDRDVVDADDVSAIIYNGRKQTIFELTESMACKDTASALRILARLLVLGEDFARIISLLAWQLKRLCLAKRIMNDCKDDFQQSAKRLQSELKVNRYFLDKFIKQVGSYTERDLLYKYGLLTEADVEVKTSGIEPKLILECLLIKLCK